MNTYKIEPVSFGTLGNADRFFIEVIDYRLGNPATRLRVVLCDEEKNFDAKVLDLPEEVYEKWGEDDSIITNWVCEELGLTLA